MRYSSLFGKTRTSVPHDAQSTNAQLLTQAGFIDQVAAGIYNFLPLGWRSLQKINQIIREEMNDVGGQEILMPALHPIEFWQATDRSNTMNAILYRTKGAGDKDFVFGPSHEEMVTPLAGKFVQSYKDLPFAIYQLQTKFRNEPRAKSGLLRGREFGMKDMYSFHRDEKDLDEYYEKVKEAYLKVYKRCGLEAYVVEASGGAFTKQYSHEFSIVTTAGEDTIIINTQTNTAQNIEIVEHGTDHGEHFRVEKAIEAGNIFKLGTKFSEDFELYFTDEDGNRKPVVMGCYGIGNTRLLGTIAEACHDENGIMWPKTVAPYLVHLTTLGVDNAVIQTATKLYQQLHENGIEVLYDDRNESAGKKLFDADLIGLPIRIVVSKRSLEKGGVELKYRADKQAIHIGLDNVIATING